MRDFLKVVMGVAGVVALILVIHILRTEANNTYDMRSGWSLIGAFAIFAVTTIDVAMRENPT